MRPQILSRLAPLVLFMAPTPALSSDAVLGESRTFTSPNTVEERCVRITRMPGATYSKKDDKEEEALCAIDFYTPEVALCPKTWSTSPGMMVYDITAGDYTGDRKGFERNACPEGKSAKELSAGALAKFKPTMNAKGTSGTFSPSPLLYYHFSRYFAAEIGVPVAVWRSMDRKTHLTEVARPGLAQSGHSHSSGMNHAGWQLLVNADSDPSLYRPTAELYTSNGTALYGILLDSPGSRYTSEVNGTRASGWGKGQNLDFQKTAPFLALRSSSPIAEAIPEGVAKAIKDPQILRDMGRDVAPQQIAYWMTDIANIVLLDFIFSQQDRIGNIDYVPYWMWVENGAVKHQKAKKHGKASEGPANALKIKRTHLNDNDAGGRVEYANFTKSTAMLEKLRHFPATTYRQLMALDKDLQSGGPLLEYVQSNFGIDERQVQQIVKNVALASAILQASCSQGDLAFDLDPEAFFLTGSVPPETVNCTE